MTERTIANIVAKTGQRSRVGALGADLHATRRDA